MAVSLQVLLLWPSLVPCLTLVLETLVSPPAVEVLLLRLPSVVVPQRRLYASPTI